MSGKSLVIHAGIALAVVLAFEHYKGAGKPSIKVGH